MCDNSSGSLIDEFFGSIFYEIIPDDQFIIEIGSPNVEGIGDDDITIPPKGEYVD